MTAKITPLRILMGWRKYVKVVAEAVKAAIPEVKIYVTGSAVEDRLTVESDIDVLVVLPHRPSFAEAVELRAKILEEEERLGFPLYVPIELHIIGEEELKRYARRGNVVPIDEL